MAVVAHVHAPEVLERADEEPGGGNQDHAERYLGDDQQAIERAGRSRNPVRGREQAGLRPVVVLGQDIFNERSGRMS